ncbi:MAG: YihY/virulence factor BrkB family protein [Bacteroidales bacterium]|nr:YihY/virulence factor BrkB family protein [Bacteroidales bacterium]
MITRIRKFTQEEIWHTSLHDRSKPHIFLIKQLRIIILAFRGFLEDRVSIRASALTYFTLLSLVPIVAMAFGVAKGFGFQDKMEDFIITNFKGQEEVLNYVIELSYTLLDGVQGGLLAGIGLVILIWSIMQVLTNIENSFNAIWQIKKARNFFRKLSDYLSIMLIAPLMIIVSSSIMVYINTRVQGAGNSLIMFQVLTPVLHSALKLIPYIIIWLVFTLLYMIMPNTKVSFKYALIAGILAGTSFQFVQWGYIHFQIGVTKFSALYGTFAALPLFLVWLQISWLIVLLGAEISFAYQNVDKYEIEAESLQISNHNKRILSLLISHFVVHKFSKGDPPPTSSKIGDELGLPIRLVRDIIYDMVRAKVIVETITESPKEHGYLPATDINKITIQYVSHKLDDIGPDNLSYVDSKTFSRINDAYNEITLSIERSDNNLKLIDIDA